MTDERLAELQEKYKDRNLFEELEWGTYANHSGYTSKQDGEFLNWLCAAAYKALKERPQVKYPKADSHKAYWDNVGRVDMRGEENFTSISTGYFTFSAEEAEK